MLAESLQLFLLLSRQFRGKQPQIRRADLVVADYIEKPVDRCSCCSALF